MGNGYVFYILQYINVAISVEKNQFNTLVEMEEKTNKDIQEAKVFILNKPEEKKKEKKWDTLYKSILNVWKKFTLL